MSLRAIGIPVCAVCTVSGAVAGAVMGYSMNPEDIGGSSDYPMVDQLLKTGPVVGRAAFGALNGLALGAVAGIAVTAVICTAYNGGKVLKGLGSITIKQMKDWHEITPLQTRILAAFSKAIQTKSISLAKESFLFPYNDRPHTC